MSIEGKLQPAIKYMPPVHNNLLARLDARLARLEEWAAAFSLLLLLLLTMAQILARNLFHTGFMQSEILSRYLVLYVMLLGAALATRRQVHIRLDIAGVLAPSLVRRLARPLSLLAAVICAVLAWTALRFWREEWQYAQGQGLELLGLILPAGFVLIAVHFLVLALAGAEEAGTR
jgi:TRAP-type C4-dicarboxylate transport system permease small subunit